MFGIAKILLVPFVVWLFMVGVMRIILWRKGYYQEDDDPKIGRDFLASGPPFILYFVVELFTILSISENDIITTLHIVVAFMYLGVIPIFWCYFRCTFFSKKVQVMWEHERESKIKKVWVFIAIVFFVSIMGYKQLDEMIISAAQSSNIIHITIPNPSPFIFNRTLSIDYEVNNGKTGFSDGDIFKILNLTTVSIAIALDRLLNQLQALFGDKHEFNPKKNNKSEALNIKGLIIYANIESK